MERRKLVRWIHKSKNNTELSERYDKWAADYESDLDEEFGWIGPKMAVEVFSRIVSKEARTLDAGAGTGLVGQALSAHGYTNLVAADLSEGMLIEARKKDVYHEFHQFVMGEELAFESESFDAVISVGVLTSGHAPASSLDELVRITKPGGHIVFTLITDLYETGGFKEKQEVLEKENKWVLAEVSQLFQALPRGEPDIFHQIWAFRVL
jgi:ubiquinone/menaquinone biosynthesis C-methylase UbiE